jgi:pre-mRNA-processing factor 6
MSGRKDFLSQKAPENYVAGLGRGATGFTTRSDLGPTQDGPSEELIKEALAKRAAQLGNDPPTAYGVGKRKGDDDDDDQFADAENEEGLLAGGNYDQDDQEADRIYQTVDERMSKRRRIQRLVPPLPRPPTPPLPQYSPSIHSSHSAMHHCWDHMPT